MRVRDETKWSTKRTLTHEWSFIFATLYALIQRYREIYWFSLKITWKQNEIYRWWVYRSITNLPFPTYHLPNSSTYNKEIMLLQLLLLLFSAHGVSVFVVILQWVDILIMIPQMSVTFVLRFCKIPLSHGCQTELRSRAGSVKSCQNVASKSIHWSALLSTIFIISDVGWGMVGSDVRSE